MEEGREEGKKEGGREGRKERRKEGREGRRKDNHSHSFSTFDYFSGEPGSREGKVGKLGMTIRI